MNDPTMDELRQENAELRRQLERAQVEQRRRQQSEQLRQRLVETIPDIVFTLQPDGSCDFISERFCEVTGLATESGLGLGWTVALHPEDRERVQAALRESVALGSEWEAHFQLKASPGEYRRFVGRASPLRDEAGAVWRWLGILSDIHDLWTAENALQSSAGHRDRFLATLVHDLRNALVCIQNAVELLQLPAATASHRARAIDMLARQAREFRGLLDDLQDRSRIIRGKIALRTESVELAALVTHAVEINRPSLDERQQRLTVALPATTVWLKADPARLTQAVSELIHNAIQFTDEGGRISISAAVVDEQVVLQVQDDGIGIPSDFLPHVFDPFTRSEQAQERANGLGLGLAVVRKVVELHGGRIQAFSEGMERGSQFVVRLPQLANPASHPAQPREDATALLAQSPRRILLVTGNASLAEEWSLLLRVAGHEIRRADHGPEALAMARTFWPEVICLDIGLPAWGEYEGAWQLREQLNGSGVYIVALCDAVDDDSCRQARKAGCDAVLSRPVKLRNLLEVIAEDERGRR